MQIDHEQVALLAERMRTLGVGRRVFLKVVGALTGAAAAGSTLGWDTPAQAQGNVPAGTKLAKEQVYRWAWPNEPSSMDVNRYAYGLADALLFAWLMKFDPNYKAIPWLAERYETSPQGDVYTFHLRQGLKWSNGDPVTAHDFVWSYQRKLDPAVGADYVGFFYDIKNAEKINKGEIKDLSQLGVKAKDDLTVEFALEGPRGYFASLMAFGATAPSHRASVEKHGDKWTEPENIVCNGIFTLESWDHNKQFTLKKNPVYFDRDKITLNRAT
jgi:ABC-type oligopeptide transport system substrate-binding subunit